MNGKKVLFVNEETTISDTYHYPFLLNKEGYADSDRKVLEEFSNQPFNLLITDFGSSYIRILLTKRKW